MKRQQETAKNSAAGDAEAARDAEAAGDASPAGDAEAAGDTEAAGDSETTGDAEAGRCTEARGAETTTANATAADGSSKAAGGPASRDEAEAEQPVLHHNIRRCLPAAVLPAVPGDLCAAELVLSVVPPDAGVRGCAS